MPREAGVKRKRKKVDFIIVNGSAKRRRKGIRIDSKSMEQRVDNVDYISQLPEHIIHQIIGCLRCTKDAARTSVLSKKWRDIWTSFSYLVFDQRKFLGQLRCLKKPSEAQTRKITNAFGNHVDNTLHSLIEQKDRSIQKFVLHMTDYISGMTTRVDQWIDLALKNNIKELEIHVPRIRDRCYSLPQCVLTANKISALRVYGCKMGPCNNLNLSNLKKVCLGKLFVNEKRIENLIRSCPLLEDFRLIYTTGLKTFQVSDLPKLKRVDLHSCSGLEKVNIQASNLESFWYLGKKYMRCIDLSTCNTLKIFTLEDPKLKDEWFQKHLSCFPVLEKLVLSKCNALKNITISSFKLKTLILRDCKQLEEADIDTPNLLSFEYKGDKMPFSSLNPSSLNEAKLYFKPSRTEEGKPRFHNGDDHTPWFARLQEFLEKFNYSRGLKLVARSAKVSSFPTLLCTVFIRNKVLYPYATSSQVPLFFLLYVKDVVIYEKPKEIVLPRVFDLKLDVVKSSVALEDLLDDILRTWHPETLSSLSISRSKLPKV